MKCKDTLIFEVPISVLAERGQTAPEPDGAGRHLHYAFPLLCGLGRGIWCLQTSVYSEPFSFYSRTQKGQVLLVVCLQQPILFPAD